MAKLLHRARYEKHITHGANDPGGLRRAARFGCLGQAVILMTMLRAAGCMAPASDGWAAAAEDRKGRSVDPPQVSNIVAVRKFFSIAPWLSSSADGSGKIDGVRFTVYLESADEPKGVFGTGTIVVTVYRLDRDPQGREVATQVYEERLPADKAYPWRSKRETALGWGYGLRIFWGQDLDLEGRDIAILVKYIREDGRAISSSRQVLKVPLVSGTGST